MRTSLLSFGSYPNVPVIIKAAVKFSATTPNLTTANDVSAQKAQPPQESRWPWWLNPSAILRRLGRHQTIVLSPPRELNENTRRLITGVSNGITAVQMGHPPECKRGLTDVYQSLFDALAKQNLIVSETPISNDGRITLNGEEYFLKYAVSGQSNDRRQRMLLIAPVVFDLEKMLVLKSEQNGRKAEFSLHTVPTEQEGYKLGEQNDISSQLQVGEIQSANDLMRAVSGKCKKINAATQRSNALIQAQQEQMLPFVNELIESLEKDVEPDFIKISESGWKRFRGTLHIEDKNYEFLHYSKSTKKPYARYRQLQIWEPKDNKGIMLETLFNSFSGHQLRLFVFDPRNPNPLLKNPIDITDAVDEAKMKSLEAFERHLNQDLKSAYQ